MDDENRLMGPPIIELDTLDQHIIIVGENIQLRMKNERPTLCERCLQFGHHKKFCRSNRELYRDCTDHLWKGRVHNWGGEHLPLLQRAPQGRRQENMLRIYNKSHNPDKMRLDTYDNYTAKETRECRGEKSYVAAGKTGISNQKVRYFPENSIPRVVRYT